MKIYRRTRADMNIGKFKPAIVYTIYIASTPEKVWQALTEPNSAGSNFSGHAVEVDLRSAAPTSCARLTARCTSPAKYRMRSTAAVDCHLQRQLAAARGKARPTLVPGRSSRPATASS